MTLVATGPVRLSPHPLQRAGAFALARLAGVAHPSVITESQLSAAVALMTEHAIAAARVKSASKNPDPGAYWWKMLFACYPNAPETHGQRHKQRRDGDARPLEQRVREGRTLPDGPLDPLCPCVFCAAPAVRHVGKVEFPLLASVEHRNVTAPGVPGFPLCRGCLASGWAIPYASRHYGLLAVFDSSDEELAAEFAVEAVDANLQMIEVRATDPPAREKRGAEEVAVTVLRRHGSRARAGPRREDFVALVLFRNGNQEPDLSLQYMDGRRCDFVCSLDDRQAVGQGWDAAIRLLTRVDRKGGIQQHGLTTLARALFDESDATLLRRLTVATRRSVGSKDAATLDDLAIHYLRKVSAAQDHEIARITAVAERVAGLLAPEGAKGRSTSSPRRNAGLASCAVGSASSRCRGCSTQARVSRCSAPKSSSRCSPRTAAGGNGTCCSSRSLPNCMPGGGGPTVWICKPSRSPKTTSPISRRCTRELFGRQDLIEVRAGAPNNGKGDGILAPVKRTRVGRDTFPYVSAQLWRRWLRDTLALTAAASPVTRSGSGQKQVAYTAGEPHRYLDDDLFGFMRAVKGGQDTQRDTVVATGTLMAVAPTRPTEDFGTMSRGMAADERPVLHGHEFYTADLAADLLIDAPSVGTFSLGGNGVRTNLLDTQADEARQLGATDMSFRGVPALRLPVEQRRERLAALLEALAALRGGAKHAAHYGDRTPAWLLLVPMKGGINPFGRVVSADRSATRIDVDVLLAEFDAWADEVDGPALIGWAPGYLPDQRAEAEQRLARLLADGRMVIGHPRQVLRDTADQLRKGTLDRWLSDPLPALP